MNTLRRLLGIFVMVAGIIGLLLSLAGLAGLLIVRPGVVSAVNTTIDTLYLSVDTSQKAMEITGKTLGATVDSVDSLSSMLSTTAISIKDAQGVLTQVSDVTGKELPAALDAATSSLKGAQEAATSLEDAIKSFESFKNILSATPLLSTFLPKSDQTYKPEKPLADTLGDLAASLKDMPATFKEMSKNMDKTDSNLATIQSSLETMANKVALISKGLSEYQTMISKSKSSMDNMKNLLTNTKNNLGRILNGATVVFTLFLLWLLAAQVVIFSQGWELYHGTAGRMDDSDAKLTAEAS
jgi:chromosome segregation ATPase